MIMRKLFYGVRGTILKSMITISIAPLVITTIILYLFIDNYSQKLAENSLYKSINYAKKVAELMSTEDNSQLINILQNTSVSGGGFFFSMDENGTYLSHPTKRGESDMLMLEALKKDQAFFKITLSDGVDYLICKEHLPERKMYIAAGIPKKTQWLFKKPLVNCCWA